MIRYVAFLRAINVAGHAVVRKEALRRTFLAAGCREVETVIQSGNVVFSGPERSAALFGRVRSLVRSLIGAKATVLFRRMDELREIIRADPFGALAGDRRVKLYVVFLSSRPEVSVRLPLRSEKEALTAIAVGEREAFVVSRPKRNGFYGFPNNFIEQELGVPATSRNWSTVTRIAERRR